MADSVQEVLTGVGKGAVGAVPGVASLAESIEGLESSFNSLSNKVGETNVSIHQGRRTWMEYQRTQYDLQRDLRVTRQDLDYLRKTIEDLSAGTTISSHEMLSTFRDMKNEIRGMPIDSAKMQFAIRAAVSEFGKDKAQAVLSQYINLLNDPIFDTIGKKIGTQMYTVSDSMILLNEKGKDVMLMMNRLNDRMNSREGLTGFGNDLTKLQSSLQQLETTGVEFSKSFFANFVTPLTVGTNVLKEFLHVAQWFSPILSTAGSALGVFGIVKMASFAKEKLSGIGKKETVAGLGKTTIHTAGEMVSKIGTTGTKGELGVTAGVVNVTGTTVNMGQNMGFPTQTIPEKRNSLDPKQIAVFEERLSSLDKKMDVPRKFNLEYGRLKIGEWANRNFGKDIGEEAEGKYLGSKILGSAGKGMALVSAIGGVQLISQLLEQNTRKGQMGIGTKEGLIKANNALAIGGGVIGAGIGSIIAPGVGTVLGGVVGAEFSKGFGEKVSKSLTANDLGAEKLANEESERIQSMTRLRILGLADVADKTVQLNRINNYQRLMEKEWNKEKISFLKLGIDLTEKENYELLSQLTTTKNVSQQLEIISTQIEKNIARRKAEKEVISSEIDLLEELGKRGGAEWMGKTEERRQTNLEEQKNLETQLRLMEELKVSPAQAMKDWEDATKAGFKAPPKLITDYRAKQTSIDESLASYKETQEKVTTLTMNRNRLLNLLGKESTYGLNEKGRYDIGAGTHWYNLHMKPYITGGYYQQLSDTNKQLNEQLDKQDDIQKTLTVNKDILKKSTNQSEIDLAIADKKKEILGLQGEQIRYNLASSEAGFERISTELEYQRGRMDLQKQWNMGIGVSLGMQYQEIDLMYRQLEAKQQILRVQKANNEDYMVTRKTQTEILQLQSGILEKTKAMREGYLDVVKAQRLNIGGLGAVLLPERETGAFAIPGTPGTREYGGRGRGYTNVPGTWTSAGVNWGISAQEESRWINRNIPMVAQGSVYERYGKAGAGMQPGIMYGRGGQFNLNFYFNGNKIGELKKIFEENKNYDVRYNVIEPGMATPSGS